jgi:hypothetical protein
MTIRPKQEEYNPYYETYIGIVPEGEVGVMLRDSEVQTLELLAGLTEEQADYRYAPGKWSLKEVLGHINDNERVMAYRLLRIARGDQTPLPGYDQDVLIANAGFAERSLASLVAEYQTIRQSTLPLVDNLTAEAWARMGNMSDHPVSARAIGYILVGHERHHIEVIKQRYLNQAGQ